MMYVRLIGMLAVLLMVNALLLVGATAVAQPEDAEIGLIDWLMKP